MFWLEIADTCAKIQKNGLIYGWQLCLFNRWNATGRIFIFNLLEFFMRRKCMVDFSALQYGKQPFQVRDPVVA